MPNLDAHTNDPRDYQSLIPLLLAIALLPADQMQHLAAVLGVVEAIGRLTGRLR